MSLDPTQPEAAPPSATTTPMPLPPAEAWPPPLPAPMYPPYPPAPPYAQNPGFMPYYPGPMAPSTSYWAIASFVCVLGGFGLIFVIGFLPILIPVVLVLGSILGVTFGHIALVDISRSHGRLVGRGMALAGLIIGYVILALALFLGIVALAASALRP